MPIGTIESNGHRNLELMNGRADGMPSFLESVVVCIRCGIVEYVLEDVTMN
jgi:hypothetical protein